MITEILKNEYPENFWNLEKKENNKALYDILIALNDLKDISLYNDKERIDITFSPSMTSDADYRITINHKNFNHSIELHKTEKQVIDIVKKFLKQGYKYEIYD